MTSSGNLAIVAAIAFGVLMIATACGGGSGRWRRVLGALCGVFAGAAGTIGWHIKREPQTMPVVVWESQQVQGREAGPLPEAPQPEEPSKAETREPTFFQRLAEGARRRSEARAAREPGKERRFDEENLIVQLPGGPWIEMDAARMGGQVTYIANNPRRGLGATVTIEPHVLQFTPEALAELLEAHTRGRMKVAEWQPLPDAELCGILSSCVGFTAEMGRKLVPYVSIYHSDRGYLRQFVVGSEVPVSLDELRETAMELARGIRPIDPERIGGALQPQIGPRDFPEWGIQVAAGGDGWWAPAREDQVEGCLWHGIHHGTSHLAVAAIVTGDHAWDPPALLQGLIGGITGRAVPETGVQSRKLPLSGLEAYEYEYVERIEDSDYHRIARTIRRGEISYLIDAGTMGGSPERIEALRRALDACVVAEQAPAVLPVMEPEIHARVFNQGGLSWFTRQGFSEARRFFEAAHQLEPADNDFFGNVLHALAMEGKPSELLDRAASASPALQALPAVREDVAAALGALGRFREAKEQYESLFADGHRNEDLAIQATRLLLENNNAAEALDLLESYRRGGSNQNLDRWFAWVLVQNSRHGEAADILERLHQDAPGNAALLVELTDVYAGMNRHAEAIALLSEAVAGEPENALLLYNLGWQHARNGDFEDAAGILEKAATFAPEEESIQQELGFVRSRLGRGHDREIRTALEPVPLPPSLRSPETTPPEVPASDADRYQIHHVSAYHFEPGKPISRTEHADILLLTDLAVSSLGTLRFNFSPLAERVFVNSVEIIDPDGKTVDARQESAQYVTDEGGEEATSGKVLCVPVPGLSIGCRLRYSVTWQDRSPSDGFCFDENFFFSRYGAKVRAVCIKGAVDLCASSTRGDVRVTDEDGYRIWAAHDLPAMSADSSLPMLERFVPTLHLGPANGDWKKIGATYLEEISEKLAPDPDIDSLARDLVDGTDDDAAKIRTLYRWVQDEFTYKAIEFGSRARIPHPPALTCTNRYGDCKDLSVLLHAMLRAIGVESRLCLVNTADLIVPELPSLDQFDHMIVHLPAAAGRPPMWLDCTDRHHALPDTVSPWLEGRRTFVLESEGSRFETVPFTPHPSPHRIRVERRIEAGPQGDALVAETFSAHGFAADAIRGYLTSIPAAERLQRMREWIASLDPDLTLDTLEIINLQDQDQPLVLELGLQAADHLDSESRLKRIPRGWERNYLRAVPQSHRSTPFMTLTAWNVETLTTSTIPMMAPAVAAAGEDERWGTWAVEPSQEGDAWSLRFTGCRKRGDYFEAESYQSFFEFWEEAQSHLGHPWRTTVAR